MEASSEMKQYRITPTQLWAIFLLPIASTLILNIEAAGFAMNYSLLLVAGILAIIPIFIIVHIYNKQALSPECTCDKEKAKEGIY